MITKQVLRKRTAHYVRWVEGYARNRHLPCNWAHYIKRKPVRHEDLVGPSLERVRRAGRFGVYYILMSKERGRTFRSIQLRHATRDPHYRMIRSEFSQFRHYYFYIYYPVLGAMALRVGSYCLSDLNLRKGLQYLEQVRSTFHAVLDRFAANQARNLNVHGQFDLLARLAKPVGLGQSKIAGIRLDQARSVLCAMTCANFAPTA